MIPCTKTVFWWDVHMTSSCVLGLGHEGPHRDGLRWFDTAGFQVPNQQDAAAATRRAVGQYLTEQPLGDEQMTDDDIAVLLFIATHHSQFGRVPRFSQIAEARGLSYAAAKQAVRRLRALGQLNGLYERRIPHLVVAG